MARPKGVAETKPRATAAKRQVRALNAAGITPLDVLLTTMRRHWLAAERERDQAKKALRLISACNLAERAAPYCHGKLALVQLSGPKGGPIQTVSLVTDDPLEAARVYQQLVSGTAA